MCRWGGGGGGGGESLRWSPRLPLGAQGEVYGSAHVSIFGPAAKQMFQDRQTRVNASNFNVNVVILIVAKFVVGPPASKWTGWNFDFLGS